MSGYELEIEQIRRAGAAAQSAGDQLANLDLGCEIGGGYGALPGAKCGEQFRTLEDTWLRHGREFSGSLQSHATNLTWAADDYNVHEDQARQAFEQVHVGGRKETL
jgi:hypothetical protein